MSFEYYTEDLLHYGVPGQKWGRRRYQNTDGTLTAAGKERYSDSVKSVKNYKYISGQRKALMKEDKWAARFEDRYAKKSDEKIEKAKYLLKLQPILEHR